MPPDTVVVIAAPTFVVLAAALLFAAAHRRDTDQAVGTLSRQTRDRDRHRVQGPAPGPTALGREVERAARRSRSPTPSTEVRPPRPVPWVPPDREMLDLSRRQFMNRSIVGLFGLGLSGFAAASLGFLWPRPSGGFGSAIRVGKLSGILAQIDDGDGFLYIPQGRMWITRYPEPALDKARATYSASELVAMEQGVIALYQKCPHLGCRVPSCVTSQWFECPCHGSQYNQVGEKKGGPAPRGMDRFVTSFSGDTLTVDTGQIIQGPPIGTNTTGQEAEGPHCVTGSGE